MLKGNRVLQKWHAFLSLFPLLLLSVAFPLWVWAEETETKTEQNPFTLEVTDNLITLQSEQASFKEILHDLEKKTGIKVNMLMMKGFMNMLPRECQR